jgi:hypothetical protein
MRTWLTGLSAADLAAPAVGVDGTRPLWRYPAHVLIHAAQQ